MYIRLPPRCQFLIILKSPENTQRVYCWSPLDSKSIDQTKYQVWNIRHHISHITYCKWICNFYQILWIQIVVAFNNLLKLILSEFNKYVLKTFISLPIPMLLTTNAYVEPKISQAKHFTYFLQYFFCYINLLVTLKFYNFIWQ